jgi:hypothetical protein
MSPTSSWLHEDQQTAKPQPGAPGGRRGLGLGGGANGEGELRELGVYVQAMGWMEEPVETEDRKGVMGWLSPEPCHLDFKVVVGSWLDWG